MGRIVNKVLSLSVLSKSNAEIKEMVGVWTDALFSIVPESRLDDALSRAIKNHTTTFAINFFDVKNAYAELEAEESAEKERADTEERTLNRVAFCAEKHNHKSPDEAIQQYFVGGHWEWLPCVHCRPDAYWQRVKDIKMNMEIKSNEAILAESEEFKSVVKGLRLVK